MKRLVVLMALALTCIMPSAFADPIQFGFVPYRYAIKELPPGYSDFVALPAELQKRQFLHKNVFCKEWPQVISLETRRQEGFSMAGAVTAMRISWKRPVCQARTFYATPFAVAVRGGREEDELKVVILAWRTDAGEIVYNGIDARELDSH